MRLIPKRPHLPRVHIPRPRLTISRADVLEFSAGVAIIAGVAMIYLPAGVILGGVAVFVARFGQVWAKVRSS